MSPALLAFWALVGWCGTPWRRWPPTPPDPDPFPWLWMPMILGIIGGMIGGWLYMQVWPVIGVMTGIDVAATAVGALVGSVTLNNIYAIARIMQMRKRQTVSGSSHI